MEKQRRGFALMDPVRQREIAILGGREAHRLGKAHRFTVEQAVAAGKKGGLASGKARAERKKALVLALVTGE